jgi:hypothetical protein
MLLSFWHLGSFLGAQTLIRNGSVLVRQVRRDARSNAGNPIVWFAVAQIVAASAIRWFVLPRFTDFQKRLVLTVVGLALSQSVTFFGIFLFAADMPHTKMELFWLSLLSAIQFIPLFASDEPENQNG